MINSKVGPYSRRRRRKSNRTGSRGYKKQKIYRGKTKRRYHKKTGRYLRGGGVQKMTKEECANFLEKLESEGSKIMETEHFAVFLDRKQYYLGRTFVWAKRADCSDYFAMNDEEWQDIRDVTQKMNQAYARTFKPDMINIAFLGNEKPHLHAHMVPRYEKPPIFENMDWTDHAWGNNYSNEAAKDPEKGGKRKIDFTGEDDRWLFQKIIDTLKSGL